MPEAWGAVSNWIARACERNGGRLGPEDWYDSLCKGSSQLWAVERDGVIEAVVVTEVTVYPRKKYLHVHVCVGHGRVAWEHLIADLERFAASAGCDGVQMDARPGWERVLRRYRKTHVFLELTFDEGEQS